MNCDISLNINKDKSTVDISKYGAVVGSSMIIAGKYFNEDSFVMEDGTPESFNSIVKREKKSFVLKSFFLTNNSTELNSKHLDKIYTEKDVKSFISGSLRTTLPKLKVINGIFGNLKKITSPLLTDASPIVVEDENFDPKDDLTRDYIVLSDTVIKKVNMAIDKSIVGEERKKAFNELMTVFVTSAFQRGYSIHVKQPMNGFHVSSGVNVFNRLNTGRKATYISSYQRPNANAHILFSTNVTRTVKAYDTAEKVKPYKDIKPTSDTGMLTHFLSEEDRILVNKFKNIPLNSKAFIANKIAQTFVEFIPNLKVSLMTTAEIKENFHTAFSRKKGFIINNEIVVNLDKFTPDTLFHELGHFYMKWLDEYDPKLKRNILNNMKNLYPEDVKSYKKIYTSTGINFSNDDILEEIFTTKLGLDSFRGLDKIIDLDEIRSFNKKEKKVVVEEGKNLSAIHLRSNDIVYVNSMEDVKLDKNTYNDMSKIPFIGNNTFISFFQPVNIGGNAIVVGPFKNDPDVATDGIKYRANMQESIKAYESFLLSGVTPSLIEKYDLNSDQVNLLEKQHAYILNSLGKPVLELPFIENASNMEMGNASFSEILFNFNSQFKYNKELAHERGSGRVNPRFKHNGRSIPLDFHLGHDQERALRAAIDFSTNGEHETPFLVKGSAGTGKTTIVKYLHKFLKLTDKDIAIQYISPTHSANLTLAAALQGTITDMPKTLKSMFKTLTSTEHRFYAPQGTDDISKGVFIVDESSMVSEDDNFWLRFNFGGFTRAEVSDLPAKYKKFFYISPDTNKRTLKAINSRFKNEIVKEEGETMIYIDTLKPDSKLMFLGDAKQIPPINESAFKISKVFDTYNQSEIDKIYRTNSEDILKFANYIRKQNKFVPTRIGNTDESLKFIVGESTMKAVFLNDLKNDRDSTTMIVFTNKEVDAVNRETKFALDGNLFVSPGDTIIGYRGSGKKSLTRHNFAKDAVSDKGFANSISYKITDAIKRSFYIKNNKFNSIKLSGVSNVANELANSTDSTKRKIKNIYSSVTKDVIPLFSDDNININDITEDELTENRTVLATMIAEEFANIETRYSKNFNDVIKRQQKFIENLMTDEIDISRKVIVDLTNKEVLVYSEENMNLSGSFVVLEKGIDYSYAITVHKSQGKSIKNVYVDLNSINNAKEAGILMDYENNPINDFKNSMFYTAVTRGINKVVVYSRDENSFEETLDIEDIGVNESEDKKVNRKIGESIQTYTRTFMKKLLGTTVLDEEIEILIDKGDFNINDMINTAYYKGDGDNMLLDKDGMDTAIQHIKNFTIQKASIREISNGLINRGLISKTTDNRLILKDADGNLVDESGEITTVPTKIKLDKNGKITTEGLKKMYGYLNKYKDLADVMFATNTDMNTVSDDVDKMSKSITREEGKKFQMNGIDLKGATRIIEEEFSDPFEVDQYVKRTIYFNKVKSSKSYYENKGLSSEDAEIKAIEDAINFIKKEDSAYMREKRKLLDVIDFKKEEGTFIHNISEFFVMALNYSQKIEYKTKASKYDYTYFLKYIKDAIVNGDRDQFENYFKQNFFNKLINEQDTDEYKQFEKAFDFVKDNIGVEDIVAVSKLLDNLESFLAENIYKKFKGPLILKPEVKIGNEAMGTVGIVDLMVIDGDGITNLFDYKTKEEGKYDNWAYSKGNIRFKNEMASYRNNAMIKASIQLSLYKLMLNEAGIKTGVTDVIYVAADIKGSTPGSVFSDKKKLRYSVNRMFRAKTTDLSADLLRFFKRKGVKSTTLYETTDASEITELITTAAGGINIDTPRNIEASANRIYNRAMGVNKYANKQQSAINQFLGLVSKKEGLEVLLPGEIKYKIPKNIKGKDATIKHIEEVLVDRKNVAFIEADFESVYYSLDRKRELEEATLAAGDKEKAIRNLLNGVDSSTYEIVKFSSDINYGTDFGGVVFLKNKITGEVRIISLNYDKEVFLEFKDNNHNILGNYITNNAIKAKYPNIKWKNTNYNMRLIKVGLMILRAKQLDPDFKVSMVLMNRDFEGGNERPIKIDMLELLDVTKALLTEASAAGDKIPSMFEGIINDFDMFNHKNYVPNPLLAFSNYVESLTSNNVEFETVFSKKGAERAKYVMKIIENYDETVNYQELLDAIQELQHSLEMRIDPSKRADNDLWKVLEDSVMFLMGFNHTISPKNTDWAQKLAFMPSAVSNVYMASFNRKITDSNVAFRRDFITYKREFNKLIQELADEKGVNLDALGESFFRSSMKDLMMNLFVDPTNQDKTVAFTLKDPTARGLSEKERSIIRFINKQIKEKADMSLNRKIDTSKGWLPLISKSRLSAREDTNAWERAVKVTKNAFNFKNSPIKDSNNLDTNREKEFSITNSFDRQIPGKKVDGVQFTHDRRYLLGIDEDGNDLEGIHEEENIFEDNIENIIDSFVMSSLKTVHFRDVTSLGMALFHNVKREEKLTGNNFDNLLDVLAIIQRKNIKGKTSDDKIPGLNFINKTSTAAVIAGSINQILLETFTNPLLTADNYLGDLVYGTVFKGQREFSLNSYRKAFDMVMNPLNKDKKLLEALDLQYGFSNSDSLELQKVLKMMEGNSIFQSHKLMYVNKLILESWQKVTLAAYMIEQGSFYAHSIDKDGNLQYDDTRDKRFYGSGDLVYKKKAYGATKRKMATERSGLTGDSKTPYEDRSLSKAYTEYDINYVKEKLVELYSSLDNSSKSMAIYYSYMSFLTKMRTWLFAKMGRYFKKPMTEAEGFSMSRLRKIPDESAEEGYRLEWVGDASEGILFSVFGIGRLFMEYKTDVFTNGTVTEVQKKNMSKLASDMFIGLVLAGFAWGMWKYMADDEFKRNPMAQIIYKRFIMATGDAFLIKALIDTSLGNGSMFIGIGILKNAFTRAGSALWMTGVYTFNGDVEASDLSDAYIRAAAGFYGPLKSATLIYDTADFYNGDE